MQLFKDGLRCRQIFRSLTHEATEPIKRAWNSCAWVDLDKDVLLRVNVDLQ